MLRKGGGDVLITPARHSLHRWSSSSHNGPVAFQSPLLHATAVGNGSTRSLRVATSVVLAGGQWQTGEVTNPLHQRASAASTTGTPVARSRPAAVPRGSAPLASSSVDVPIEVGSPVRRSLRKPSLAHRPSGPSGGVPTSQQHQQPGPVTVTSNLNILQTPATISLAPFKRSHSGHFGGTGRGEGARQTRNVTAGSSTDPKRAALYQADGQHFADDRVRFQPATVKRS